MRDPRALSDAAWDRADRLPGAVEEMPEGGRSGGSGGGGGVGTSEQCAQAQLHFSDRAPAALHPGAR